MPQTLVRNCIHIIFSTKHREPLIFPPHEEELHNYIGGLCKKLDCQPIKVGGYHDHIHILCLLSKKIALMKLLEEVKSHSSKWMKMQNPELGHFYWQNGYGAFSVSPSQVNAVISYIENQHEHHSNGRNFKDEFRLFLRKYEVEYDERYLWD